MRRRLWHSLRILDAHASNDRGSDPVIPDPEYNTRLPLNINDADISPDSVYPPQEREGPTEMTLCLMLQTSTKHFWRLCYVTHANMERAPLPIECDWDMRQHEIEVWQQTLQEKYTSCCDESIPLHRFIKSLGENMIRLGSLLAIRPMQRHPAAKPPHVPSEHILKLALELFEGSQAIYMEQVVRQWTWYVWVEWHPLAVALAELCSYTEGPLVEQAWKSVDITYDRYVNLVADSRRGMLWRPIEKLYKKAKANRAAKQAAINRVSVERNMAGSEPIDRQSLSGSAPTDPPGPGQQPSQLKQLTLNDEPPDWTRQNTEPVDMAWLDWAIFAEDVTDFNMVDPGSSNEMPWL